MLSERSVAAEHNKSLSTRPFTLSMTTMASAAINDDEIFFSNSCGLSSVPPGMAGEAWPRANTEGRLQIIDLPLPASNASTAVIGTLGSARRHNRIEHAGERNRPTRRWPINRQVAIFLN